MSDLYKISDTNNARMWTDTAIDCYLLGCTCSKCYLYKVYFLPAKKKCMMKKTVLELVQKFGKPKLG